VVVVESKDGIYSGLGFSKYLQNLVQMYQNTQLAPGVSNYGVG
jgi:hypothetical protein